MTMLTCGSRSIRHRAGRDAQFFWLCQTVPRRRREAARAAPDRRCAPLSGSDHPL